MGPDADSHRQERRRFFSSPKNRAHRVRLAVACLAVLPIVVGLPTFDMARAATGFDLTLVRPSPSGSSYVHQESVTLRPPRTLTFGAFLDGVLDPLVLREPITNAREGGLVEQRLEATLGLAYAAHERLTLALSLAAIPWQNGSGGNVPLAWAAATPHRTAFGDASLFVKVGLWGKGEEPGWRLSFSSQLFLPTGQSASYAGAGGVTGLFRLWGGYVARRGSFTVGGGYDLVPRADVPLVGILVDDRWTLAVAGAFRLDHTVTLLAEAQASVLAETARRLYPRGVAAALAQAPAYALAGARLNVLPTGDLLVAAWTGIGSQPGAAKLGLLVGWGGTWDTAALRATGETSSPKPPANVVATSEPSSDRAAPDDDERRRDATQDATEDAKEQRDVIGETASAEKAAAQKPTGAAREAAEETEEIAPGRRTPSKPRATPAEAGALATLDGDEIVLAAPLPFKGRSAKLAAGSIPTLKAIAKLLKAQRTDTRLAIRLEAVGSRPGDLALARKRARALKGVFAHLAHWPAKRITAEGTRASSDATDVTAPPLRLVLSSPSRARSEARPNAEEPPAREPPPEARAAEGAGSASPSAQAPEARAATPAGPLARRDGNAILLRGPLPFQGRTAKLDATSIPALKAIAAVLKRERGKKVLVLELEAVGEELGDEASDRALAAARAEALREVFAHLAHWPAKRVVARGVPSRGTGSDPSLPPLSLALVSAAEAARAAAPAETNATPKETTSLEASPRKPPREGELARLEDHRIVLATPLPFDGDGPKLTAEAIPLVRAITKVLKAQPAGVVLTVRVEAVGSSADDLALAQARARGLAEVFARLAHWPSRRMVAVGAAPTGAGEDVAAPAVALELGASAGHGKRPRSSRKR